MEPEPTRFTINKMQQEFEIIEKARSMVKDIDRNAQSFFKILRTFHEAFASYNIIHEKKMRVHRTDNCFFKDINQ